MRFEWSNTKNKANRKKHGVSFEEALIAFYNTETKLFIDPDHSDDEETFIVLGFGANLRLLVVVHCYRENDHFIRIISARKADKKERKIYEETL
jgi:uncharacterized DUF497 family protein